MSSSRPVRAVLLAITLLVAGGLHAPIFVPVVLSFFPRVRGAIQWQEPGLDAYVALLANQAILTALWNTLLVGGAAVVLSLLLGLFLSMHQVFGRPFGGRLLQAAIVLPFVLPPIITGLSLLLVFREIGLERSLATVVIGHTIFVLALVYRLMRDRLESLSSSMLEASADLGAGPWYTFRHVILPNLYGTMVGAAMLAFALSFDETMITFLVTGTDSTLPMRLWSMMRLGFTPDINALVTLILAAVVALSVVVVQRLIPNDARGDGY